MLGGKMGVSLQTAPAKLGESGETREQLFSSFNSAIASIHNRVKVQQHAKMISNSVLDVMTSSMPLTFVILQAVCSVKMRER